MNPLREHIEAEWNMGRRRVDEWGGLPIVLEVSTELSPPPDIAPPAQYQVDLSCKFGYTLFCEREGNAVVHARETLLRRLEKGIYGYLVDDLLELNAMIISDKSRGDCSVKLSKILSSIFR